MRRFARQGAVQGFAFNDGDFRTVVGTQEGLGEFGPGDRGASAADVLEEDEEVIGVAGVGAVGGKVETVEA